MQEIMILRSVDNEPRLKLFQVDETTLSKLTRIRGNLYRDDPRLRLVKDLPTPEPKITITPAAIEATEKAFALYKLMQKSKVTTSPHVIEPEPKPVLTFEEQIQKDWKTLPGIRAEFVSLASYAAYCRAVQDGRCRAYGV